MISNRRTRLALTFLWAAGIGAITMAPPAHAVDPNDPLYSSNQWNLRQIHAPEGWAIRTDASSVIVADIDSGVRAAHEDMAANMWHNPADGTVGYNAIDDSHNPIPAAGGNGHGTGTASVLGAVGNNGKGISGVAWNIKVMACRYDADNSSDAVKETQISKCIDFAIANGAKIINASWSVANTGALRAAFLRAQTAGIVIVGAAGNSSFDLDAYPTLNYPQGCDLDNVVLVAATTEGDAMTTYSGYGYNRVKLAAPGGSMTSGNANSFVPICGMGAAGTDYPLTAFGATSAATATVSGALALVEAQFTGESYQQSILRVLQSVDILPLVHKITTSGRLNLFKALSPAANRPPNDNFANAYTLTGTSAASTGLNLNMAATRESGEPNHAGNAGSTSVWWQWTAPASGTATIATANSSFDTSLGVYTGTSVAVLSTIASSNDVSGGDKTSKVVFGAVGGTTYHIAVDGWRTDNFSKTTGAVNLSVALTGIPTPTPTPTPSPTPTPTPYPVGTGTGLRGDYYDQVDFTSPRLVRTDAVINLTVAPTPPPPMLGFPSALGGSTFSARWTGQVQPRYSESYTFYTQTDDGVRLWVNGQQLVDNWTPHVSTENSGTITLTAGQKYDIVMEYFQGSGSGIAQLSWSGADVAKAIVPQTQLYPNAGPTAAISSPVNNATFTDPATIAIVATAADTDGTVAKVEFYNGTVKLGEDSSSTGGWTYNWTPVAQGSYSITARALDNLGAATSSTAIAVVVNQNTGVGTGTGLLADYYDQVDFTSPRLVRTDAVVNLTVAPTPPPPMLGFPSALGGSTFSARWTGQVQPRFTETYTFYTQTDDGVRLWVNGQQLVDNWTPHASTENSGTIALTAGQKYDIVMEYFQGTGSGIAQLSWSGADVTKEIVPQTQLYPNVGPTAAITSPLANALFTDPATVAIAATASDADGSIAKVEFYNGTVKLGEDTSSTGGWTYNWTPVAEGSYSITARAIDNLGAAASSAPLAVVVDPGVGTGLLGEYFNDSGGVHLAGSPVFSRADEVVDFAWGTGSPDPSVHVDAFSARWSGQIEPLYTETYNLYTLTDDGVRLYIDGDLVINNWTVHAPTENSTSITFVAGQRYDIVMEYFENASGATAKLSWSSPSQPKEVVPAEQLYGPE